jgi:hypothetical protein
MTRPDHARAETDAMLAAAGITVTDEGRQRTSTQLAELDAYWTPERRERAYREHDQRVADAAA